MHTVTFNTPAPAASTWTRTLGLVSLAAVAWGLSAAPAQARNNDDVYWSVGVTSPGVAVGVSNAPPPRPVVVYPQPVVVHQPAPVVIHQPYAYGYAQPVVVAPQPVVFVPGRGWVPRWDERRHHRHHHQSPWKNRYGQWDDDHDGDRRR